MSLLCVIAGGIFTRMLSNSIPEVDYDMIHDSDWATPAVSESSPEGVGMDCVSSVSLLLESEEVVLLSRLPCLLRAAFTSGTNRLHSNVKLVMSVDMLVRNGLYPKQSSDTHNFS